MSHAMTDAVSAGRFPVDEPLNAVGLRQLDGGDSLTPEVALCGPEVRAGQTADRLGLNAAVEPALADLDVGAWQGLSLEDIDPGELAGWLTDPSASPHGGESVDELLHRVRGWLESLTDNPARVVAVTHPAIVRAAILVALNAPPISFWRIDVAPVSRTVLHYRAPGWTLRA